MTKKVEVEVEVKNYVLVIEYINDYASNIYDARIFSSKKEVDDYICKFFNIKSVDWKYPSYQKRYICSTEIFERATRPCPYYYLYLFER